MTDTEFWARLDRRDALRRKSNLYYSLVDHADHLESIAAKFRTLASAVDEYGTEAEECHLQAVIDLVHAAGRDTGVIQATARWEASQ